jgi:hypothetical protein
MRYAWDWFSYHASQRLTAFNFFLVLLGALLVGYVQAVVHDLPALGAALATFGVVVSAAFWAMDVRNAELVECGRVALDGLEPSLSMRIRADDDSRTFLPIVLRGQVERRIYARLTRDEHHKQRRQRFYTHSFWLRNVLMLVGVCSALAALWAILGYPGN